MPDPDAYHQLALAAGLPPGLARRSFALTARFAVDSADLVQPQDNPLLDYADARTRQDAFARRLEAFGGQVAVLTASRPGGTKGLERLVEKYLLRGEVPLDLLAGKVIVPSVERLYDVGEQVGDHFSVVGFRDRVVRPRASSYRDLQFIVEVGGHFAELKVVHRLLDELDGHEHTLYELRRTLEGRLGHPDRPLSAIETLVLDRLTQTSASLFQEAWRLALREGGET